MKLLNIKKIWKLNASTNIEGSAVSETVAGANLEVNAEEVNDVDASTNINKSTVASNWVLTGLLVFAGLANLAYAIADIYTAYNTTSKPPETCIEHQPDCEDAFTAKEANL